MKNLSSYQKQEGAAILGTVFLLATFALVASMALIQSTEHSKVENLQSIRKKSYELVIDNLKTKLANPHICSAAFKGKTLGQAFSNIDAKTESLISMQDLNTILNLKTNSNGFNPYKNGQFIAGLVDKIPSKLVDKMPSKLVDSIKLDPILPGLDASLIKFEKMVFNVENNRPLEISSDIVLKDPSKAGQFKITGAGKTIPPTERTIVRYKASLNVVANIGFFSNDYYVSNSANHIKGSVFTTTYVKEADGKIYPRKTFQLKNLIITQVKKGNISSGYSYQWTPKQLEEMGVSMEKQNMEIPLIVYIGTDGKIKDCFTEASHARTCELNGGIWRSANPSGFECEPRNKCISNNVIYAPNIAAAKKLCPVPFNEPLKIGVAMALDTLETDHDRTSFLCRWCNTNRY